MDDALGLAILGAPLGGAGVNWLLLDRFTTALGAGSVNGSLSEPSKHARTLTDSVPNAVITGGQYKVTSEAAARDPWLRYTTGWARVAGRMLRFDVTPTDFNTANTQMVGFANTLSAPPAVSHLGLGIGASDIRALPANTQMMTYTGGVTYSGYVILRSTGCFILVDGKLRWIDRSEATATLYPSSGNQNIDAAIDYRLDNLGVADLPLTIPTLFPIPTLSDTFSVPSVIDYGSNGLNATPVNLTLNGPTNRAEYNGATSTMTLVSQFATFSYDPRETTVIMRIKPSLWDASQHYWFRWHDSVLPGNVYCRQVNATTLEWGVNLGASKTVQKATSSTDWLTMGMTVSSSGDVMRAFFDGAQEGIDQSGFGSAAFTFARADIGFFNAGSYFKGYIGDLIVAKTAASIAQMSTLHTALAAGTLTTATLDTIFGAGNYVWYKQDEQYQSNGLAHIEAGGVNGANVAWNMTGLSWNAGNKAYISPTPGADVIVNGGFDADTDWTKGTGWTIAAGVATKAAGTASTLEAIADNLTLGSFYRAQYTTVITADTIWVTQPAGPALTGSGTFSYTGRATSTKAAPRGNATANGTLDNFSSLPLTFADCLRAVAPASAGEPYAAAKLTITANTQAGLVINLDDYTTPANCIHVYYDRIDSKIYARELTAGTWGADTLAGIAATYSAGAYLEARRIGTEVYVFYNGVYVGSWTTALTSANTQVALFATDSGSYAESVTVYPTGGYDYSNYA